MLVRSSVCMCVCLSLSYSYNVLMGTLSPTHSLTRSLTHLYILLCVPSAVHKYILYAYDTICPVGAVSAVGDVLIAYSMELASIETSWNWFPWTKLWLRLLKYYYCKLLKPRVSTSGVLKYIQTNDNACNISEHTLYINSTSYPLGKSASKGED